MFVSKAVNEVPFNNPDKYALNKMEYPSAPKIVGNILYLPADFVADATDTDYNYNAVKNTLTWEDKSGEKYPVLIKALKSKFIENTQELKFSMDANFKDNINGSQKHYDTGNAVSKDTESQELDFVKRINCQLYSLFIKNRSIEVYDNVNVDDTQGQIVREVFFNGGNRKDYIEEWQEGDHGRIYKNVGYDYVFDVKWAE